MKYPTYEVGDVRIEDFLVAATCCRVNRGDTITVILLDDLPSSSYQKGDAIIVPLKDWKPRTASTLDLSQQSSPNMTKRKR